MIGALATAAVLGPATAAKRPLTKKRALKLFYTKGQADGRFYTKPEADGRFVQDSGLILVGVDHSNWVAASSGITANHFSNETSLDSTGAFVDQHANLPAQLPIALYGERLRLVGVELCYDATDLNATLDALFLNVHRDSTDVGNDANPQFSDDTNRDDQTCRRYDLSSPHTLTEEDTVNVVFRLDYNAAADVDVGRTTFILEPGGLPAAAPARTGPSTALQRADASPGESGSQP